MAKFSAAERNWSQSPLTVGCPVWACKHWANLVYPANTSQSDYLYWYSRCFSSVEGNSTFYAMPEKNVVERWIGATPNGFRFVLKFPRILTHEKLLVDCAGVLSKWLDLLELLRAADRLGPAFIQLPPSFGKEYASTLVRFLDLLPPHLPIGLETRHADWFDEGRCENWLNDRLVERRINRVVFDANALFSLPASDATESESQRRKPKLPVRKEPIGSEPILRFVGRNNPSEIGQFIEQWVCTVSDWLVKGLRPHVFLHSPDDQFAPNFARIFMNELTRFHSERGEKPQVCRLPDFVAENSIQKTLFD